MRPDLFLAMCEALAACADSATGRHLPTRAPQPTPDALNAPLAPCAPVCDLPSTRRVVGSTHAKRNSPSAHARRKSSPPTTSGRRWRAPQGPPRSLLLQRLAAELVARSHGLDRRLIGAVCDAIRGADIDPTAVTAAQIRSAPDEDTRETGWSWPYQIQRPGAFLRCRLSRVSGRLDALAKESTSGPGGSLVRA